MNKTYIPLYRKYRPQTFHDLIGQENITQALSNAIKLNKVAHAYLFCGPRGTGKTSSARILAKSLNCVNGPTTEPCGTCPSCTDITNSTPVDVIEIDAASNRSVEDAQNILEKIQYVPIHGKYKIYIIDEVHMLSVTAFNALLKTLEEPPENVVFILATTEAHKVLETIISRCQRFDFRRITVEDIVNRLQEISEKEEINISKEALYAIAKSVQGGMRDALALLDQLSILDTKKQIEVEDVENILGKISVNVLYNLTEKITSNNPQEAVLEINKIYAKGNEPLQIISNLIEYFRNLLIIKTCSDKDTIINLTQLNDDLIEKLTGQTQRLDTNVINYVIDKLAVYLREIKNASDRYLWLEVCIIELSNKLSTVGFSDLVGRIETLERAMLGEDVLSSIQRPSIQQTPVYTSQPTIAVPIAKTEPSPASSETKQIEHTEDVTESVSVVEEKVEHTPEQTQIKPVAEKQLTQETVIQQPHPQVINTNGNGTELWNALLEKFTSLPSKMFYANLSCPVAITQERVVVGFTKDVFVTQARAEAKLAPLRAAVKDLFGNDDMPIEITLITEAETESFKNDSKKKVTFSEPPKAFVPKAEVPVPSNDDAEEDKEYYEKQLAAAIPVEKEQPQKPKNHSDQAKMILELFNGKYMD